MAGIASHHNRHTTMRISLALFLLIPIVTAKFGSDKTVCDMDAYAKRAKTDTGPKKPQLPQQWTTRIEGNIMEHNYTQDIMEFYDGVNNRGAVTQYLGAQQSKMIFLYDTNELITLNYDNQASFLYDNNELITLNYDNNGNPPRCRVDDLVKSSAKNVFGLYQYANGSEHIFSANQALRFGNGTPEVYIGQAEARDGVNVEAWESCLYWDSQDATFHLTWYFTSNSTWSTAVTSRQVPVEAFLTGVVHVNTTFSYNVTRRYIFADFKPVLFYGPVGAFETPAGTYCVDRVSKAPIRNVTSMFRFTSEILEPSNSYINWIKEYYDYNLNLVRYDYAPDPGSGSQYGNGRLIRVHDFNTGVAYIVAAQGGNCSVSTISGLGFDAKSLDAGKVRIRTSKEFFYFDKVKYEYAGQRLARGITCDVWVAQRNDYPPGYDSPLTTWEWYFASAEWMENVGKKFEFLLPIMLQVTSISPPMNYIYNIYDYSEDDPQIWKTDIGSCFNNTQKKRFQMEFPGDYRDDIASDVGDFSFALIQKIVQVGNVSPIRVNNLQVDYTKSDIVVSFTLLGKAPIQGDVNMQGGFQDFPLSSVVTAITNSISGGQFVVTLDPTKFPNLPNAQLTAKPYSAKSWDVQVVTMFGTPGAQGYTSGAMGGLGVAMLIIGLAFGFGILFAVYKMKGGSFENSFSPKTFSDSKEME